MGEEVNAEAQGSRRRGLVQPYLQPQAVQRSLPILSRPQVARLQRRIVPVFLIRLKLPVLEVALGELGEAERLPLDFLWAHLESGRNGFRVVNGGDALMHRLEL